MNQFDAIVADWKGFSLPEFVKRDVRLDLLRLRDFIITISGPRRAGKTYFMFQLIDRLRTEEGINRENIFYVNLEDDRLFPFTTRDLDMLIERYQELSEIDEAQDIYLFLDEIQNIERWSSWVRRVHDLRKDIRIILTGSSSRLLGREISTNLRGRTYNVTILPVSFSEYLEWKQIKPVESFPSTNRKVELKRAFNQYLGSSSYPQILFGDYDRRTIKQILQEYYEVMLLRDIIERHSVRNVNVLRLLGKLIFASVSSEFSYSRLHNSLKSMGVNVSKRTIIDYISYFEEAYLFFQNPAYSSSYRAQISSIKKIYCVDSGLVDAVSFRFSEDRGKFLENLVFIELMRRGKEVYYHRDRAQCDFLVKEGLKVTQAIQASYSLEEPATRERELRGLLSAMSRYGLNEGLILTMDDFEDLEKDGRKIRVRPVWFWLQKKGQAGKAT